MVAVIMEHQTMAEVGRPTDYKPEFCEIAFRLAANGGTDVEIADALEIHISTFYRWKAERDGFARR